MNQLVPFADRTHALVAAAGERASYRFFEFFTAQIQQPEHAARLCARGERILRLICDARCTMAQQGRSMQETARGRRQAFRHPSRNKRTAASSPRSSCEGSSRLLNFRAIPGDRGATSGRYSRHSSRPT